MRSNVPKLMRSPSAFVLITAFLLLSNCPLRRAMQGLISGNSQTEAPAGRPQTLLAVCQGIIDRSGSKLSMPEMASQLKARMFPAIINPGIFTFRRFCYAVPGLMRSCYARVPYLDPVPIYLRNRIILI